MNSRVAIDVDCSSVTCTAGQVRILEDVNVSVRAGEKVGIIGPNGSGKSTLVRVLSGLRVPEFGEARVDGAPISSMKRRDIARLIAVVEQAGGAPWDLTVWDCIALGRIPHHPSWRGPGVHDREVIRAAAESTKVTHLLDRKWRNLSGGERQRSSIARALAQETPVILLDEPTNHLDVLHRLEVLDLVRQSRATSVIVLHDLNLAAMFCERLIVMSGGRAVDEGPPAEVLTPELISRVFGVSATVDKQGAHVHVVYRDPTEARAAGLTAESAEGATRKR